MININNNRLMEQNRNLFSVYKTEAEKITIIIKNTLIMLGNRIYIDKDGIKQSLLNPETATKKVTDQGDGTFIVKANNGENYAIKIIFQRIAATGKQSIISDFFQEYAKYKKIIIARDYNNKIADYVTKQHTQIFREATMLQDLIKYRDQPKFELLSPLEIEQFKKEYNATDYTTKKMLRNDPVAKYFALKKGDILRIIRPSPTSGEAIDYRIIM